MTETPARPTTLEAFVAAEGRRFLRLARALTATREDAEDLWQDTFADVIRHWTKVAAADSSVAYVRAMTSRRHLSNHRRLWRTERSLPPTDLEPRLRPTDDATEEVDARASLLSLLGTLPARTRTILVLRYLEDLTDADIADALASGQALQLWHLEPTLGATKNPVPVKVRVYPRDGSDVSALFAVPCGSEVRLLIGADGTILSRSGSLGPIGPTG